MLGECNSSPTIRLTRQKLGLLRAKRLGRLDLSVRSGFDWEVLSQKNKVIEEDSGLKVDLPTSNDVTKKNSSQLCPAFWVLVHYRYSPVDNQEYLSKLSINSFCSYPLSWILESPSGEILICEWRFRQIRTMVSLRDNQRLSSPKNFWSNFPSIWTQIQDLPSSRGHPRHLWVCTHPCMQMSGDLLTQSNYSSLCQYHLTWNPTREKQSHLSPGWRT